MQMMSRGRRTRKPAIRPLIHTSTLCTQLHGSTLSTSLKEKHCVWWVANSASIIKLRDNWHPISKQKQQPITHVKSYKNIIRNHITFHSYHNIPHKIIIQSIIWSHIITSSTLISHSIHIIHKQMMHVLSHFLLLLMACYNQE